MPQPLSRVAPNAGYEIGNVGFNTIRERPQLAVLALEALATWSHVESFMLRTYVELAGGEQADAAAVYLAMDTANAKSKAIAILAERKLSPDVRKLLNAIIKVVKTQQKDRDKLAHWIWGTSPALTDAFLLADPRDLAMTRDNIYVYREVDFTQMIERFRKTAGWGLRFRFILIGHPANRENALFDELCAEPEIAERLNRPAQPD